jgi:hypothetical protein
MILSYDKPWYREFKRRVGKSETLTRVCEDQGFTGTGLRNRYRQARAYR